MVSFVLILLCAIWVQADDVSPRWHTDLCLDNTGLWHKRIPIFIKNLRNEQASGDVVCIKIGDGDGKARLVGSRADDIRLCDDNGQEFLWAILDSSGQLVRRGIIPTNSFLYIPVECKPHSNTRYWIYFENPFAWAVPDLLTITNKLIGGRLETPAEGLNARAGALETLSGIKDTGSNAPWIKTSDYIYRFPVVWLNFSSNKVKGWFAVDISKAISRLHREADFNSVLVADNKSELPAYRLGSTLLFEATVEPLTRHTFYVYFKRSDGQPRSVSQQERRELSANPALPGSAIKETETDVSPSTYKSLMESPVNLVKNPSFELGEKYPENWTGWEQRSPARMEIVNQGLFGKRCVKIEWQTNATPQWAGWRQDVPARGGKTYFYAGWTKCDGIEGGVQLHAHFRKADGSLSSGQAMVGAGPSLNGTTDWTLLCGLFKAPPDAEIFQIHFTMQAKGTVYHDGALLMEVNPARCGNLETRLNLTSTKPAVWAVNPIVKVFQDDIPPAKQTAVRITSAKGEKEPLQVALRSAKPFDEVQVSVEPPRHSRGSRLTNFTIGIVGYVPVDHPSGYYSSTTPVYYRKLPNHSGFSDGWQGFWPDPILPKQSFTLPANTTQPVWITFRVPQDAPAGEYKGSVRFTSGGRAIAELPFSVYVWDFTIPDQMHIKAIFDVRQSGALWKIPGKTPDEVRRLFWQFMADYRVCPDTIQPPPKIKYENDKVSADFTEFDRAAEYYLDTLKLPHFYTPWKFYLFGWGHPPSAKFGEQPYDGTPPFDGVDRRKLRPQFIKAYQECLKVFWEHLVAKGWDKKCVLYISDEPFDSQKPIREQMKALCEMIHAVNPAIPIYSSTWHHQPDWDGYITVWGIGNYGVVPVEKIEHIKKTGARLWWTTDGQMCLDTPYCAIERLLSYFCFKYGAEAYEFWGIDWLTYNPYEFGWHRFIRQSEQPGKYYYVRYPNGDGYLVYPWTHIGYPGFVPSVRLEQARDGCEDYEYFYLLQEKINSAKKLGRSTTEAEQSLSQALELVKIPNSGGTKSTRLLPRPDAVLEAREKVALAIEKLSKY